MQLFIYSGHTVNAEPVLLAAGKTRASMGMSFDIVMATNQTLPGILHDPKTVGGFIPGSDSSQNIRDQIGDDGMRMLHDFVSVDGGALAGFCAGGYLLNKTITYGHCFTEPRHRRQSSRNIGLVDATCYGPLAGLVLDYALTHPENPYISITNIDFQHQEQLISTPVAYWHGGISLLAAGQRELQPLATFTHGIKSVSGGELGDDTANIAIGFKDFASGGRVITSAIHPEVTGAYLDKYVPQMAVTHAHYRDLQAQYAQTARVLTAHDGAIATLFGSIVSKMLECRRAENHKSSLASCALID